MAAAEAPAAAGTPAQGHRTQTRAHRMRARAHRMRARAHRMRAGAARTVKRPAAAHTATRRMLAEVATPPSPAPHSKPARLPKPKAQRPRTAAPKAAWLQDAEGFLPESPTRAASCLGASEPLS